MEPVYQRFVGNDRIEIWPMTYGKFRIMISDHDDYDFIRDGW